MKKRLKRIIPLLLTTTMIFSQGLSTWGATSYISVDEYVMESQKIVEGLTYQHAVKLTSIGNIDMYTLRYKANSANLDLEIFRSSELGKREKLTELAKTENILAGVNASFFDTTRTYSDILGLEKDNGEVFYARNGYNETPQASALMFGEQDNIFDVGYIVPNLTLKTSTGRSLVITGYNTVSSFHNAAVLRGDSLTDTTYIDKNYSVYKVITDSEGYITQVVEPKTVVAVADDQYLVTLPEGSYEIVQGDIQVGKRLSWSVTANVDLDKYETIVSGGGTLVKDGQVALSGIQVSGNSRQPRTAIGVTLEGDIIQMVVDGRGDSLGATLQEMANFMIQKGAYHAISLDGGGSSEIVKKDISGTIQVANTPSDGVERRVVNGIGFVSTINTGVATQAQFLNTDRTFVGYPLTMSIVGKDLYYNNVNLDKTLISYTVEGVDGYFNGSKFIAETAGTAVITAYYNGISLSSQEVTVKEQPTEIFFENSDSVVEPYGTTTLKMYTLDSEGYRTDISDEYVTWSVDNIELATIEAGVLSTKGTAGKVTVTASTIFGEAKKVILIGNDKTNVSITGFENGETVTTTLTPQGVDGKAVISQDWVPAGKNSVKLRYGFKPNIDEKQVVSANFTNIVIDRADTLKFDMTTSAMKNAVTATLVDATGTTYTLEMADGFLVGGKRTLVADLPSDLSYPLNLKSINVEYQPSSEKTTVEVGAIYFDNIMTEIYSKIDNTQPVYPKTDSLATETSSSNRLSVIGRVSYPTNNQYLAVNSLSPKGLNSSKTYVSKVSPTLTQTVANTTVVQDAYSKTEEVVFDTNVYTLKSSAATLLKSQPEQWNKLLSDIRSTSKKNIVIIANKSPIGESYDDVESLAFTKRLTEIAETYGKNIYFVNGTSQEETPKLTYYNNVRYIDLPQLSLTSVAVAPWSVDFYLEDGDLKYNFSK